MAGLAEIARREVERYAAPSFNSQSYAALDDERQVYIAMSIIQSQSPDRAIPIVMARVVGDTIIIESDMTDKPLVDALIQAGIPRDKIVLAYEGESTSDTTQKPEIVPPR